MFNKLSNPVISFPGGSSFTEGLTDLCDASQLNIYSTRRLIGNDRRAIVSTSFGLGIRIIRGGLDFLKFRAEIERDDTQANARKCVKEKGNSESGLEECDRFLESFPQIIDKLKFRSNLVTGGDIIDKIITSAFDAADLAITDHTLRVREKSRDCNYVYTDNEGFKDCSALPGSGEEAKCNIDGIPVKVTVKSSVTTSQALDAGRALKTCVPIWSMNSRVKDGTINVLCTSTSTLTTNSGVDTSTNCNLLYNNGSSFVPATSRPISVDSGMGVCSTTGSTIGMQSAILNFPNALATDDIPKTLCGQLWDQLYGC